MPFHHKTPDPPFETAIDAIIISGCWIKVFVRGHGILLNLEPKRENSRKRIGELQNAYRTNQPRLGTGKLVTDEMDYNIKRCKKDAVATGE